jgi:hypothetical protein
MVNKILPQQADNTYRGSKIALVFFVLVVLLKLVIGVNSIFMGHNVASSADGIPLDTFTPAGTQTVVSLFASLGLSLIVICLVCILVLIRYRTLVPFMFSLLLLDQLSRKLINHFLPVPRTGSPPGSIVTLVLLAMMIVGLALSLWRRDRPERP